MKKLAIILVLYASSLFAGTLYTLNCEKQGLVSGSPSNVLTMTTSAGFGGGGLLVYCTHATNASNAPIVSCTSQNVAIVNQAGTITATLSTQVAVAESSPGAAAISAAISQTNAAGVITIRVTPTISNYSPTFVAFSIYAIMPSVSDLRISCL